MNKIHCINCNCRLYINDVLFIKDNYYCKFCNYEVDVLAKRYLGMYKDINSMYPSIMDKKQTYHNDYQILLNSKKSISFIQIIQVILVILFGILLSLLISIPILFV